MLSSNNSEAAVKLAALIEQIRGRYTLSYVPAVSRPDNTFCRIHLRLAPDAQMRHPELLQGRFEIRARTGYYR